ncbi:MAG TPA: hypothetical protein VFI27_04470 [candidate division Zixibacteria bacterium]|nr:hypothetical protein [candidate division Zixibacteria bacterium]
MVEKLNCWEFMECGREPGGFNVDEGGICRSSIASRYDGINGGKWAGRFCWPVAGTNCNGDLQGTFAEKIKDCLKCPFFLTVAREEGKSLVFIKQGANKR